MTQDLYVVGYDGNDRQVLEVAIAQAKKAGAALHIVHVLEWSPYAFLTPEEIEARHRVREEELTRAQNEVMQPVLDTAKASGVDVTGNVRFGAAVSILRDIAKQKDAQFLFVARNSAPTLTSKLFGSVAIGLAQSTTVPLVIVP